MTLTIRLDLDMVQVDLDVKILVHTSVVRVHTDVTNSIPRLLMQEEMNTAWQLLILNHHTP